MADNYMEEEMQDRVRKLLNAHKVRLWEPPYTREDGQKGEEPENIVAKYSTELGISEERTRNILEHLRQHALEKLSARKRFQESCVASLKIKLAGHIPDTLKRTEANMTLNLDISLKVSGLDLKQKLSEASGMEPSRLKVISGGKVMEDTPTLETQGVRNLTTIMCLVLSESEAEARKQEEQVAKVTKTRQAAEFLSSYKDEGTDADSNYYLQIADQTGKLIDLPDEERKALALAMTLHEKGRAAIKHKRYGESVLLLLEADKEFKKCRSDILNAVDNYALLCLDIVWCYLCLRNIDSLHDAERRLKECEQCFHRSYGVNLERLAKVKGETGEEQALFMRLHLLQGILAFHQHSVSHARDLLNRANEEIQHLQVDEDKMTQVLTMGFSVREARLGLRACRGNVQATIAYIMKKKEEKEQMKEKEREEKRRKKIARNLGKTAGGEDVNVVHYESLQSMGFAKGASAEALRQSNNDIMAAIQALQDHPELLDLPDPEPPKFKVTDELISQITAMGFDVEQAKAALHHFHADAGRSIEELLRVGGLLPQAWLDAIPSTSNSSSSTGSASTSPTKSPEEEALRQEAIANIVPDLPEGEEDHLDLCLDEEAQFLQEYLALMNSMSQ